MSQTSQIEAFVAREHLDLGPEIVGKLEQFVDLLLEANAAMNLVGRLPRQRIERELICDSLMPLTLEDALQSPVVDIGSGAGLPGIPLAIARPDLEFTLVEPRDRRYRFLGHAMRKLELPNVERVRSRVEDLVAPAFATAISKAFAPVPQWLEAADALLVPGGQALVLAADEDVQDFDAPGFDRVALRSYRWRKDAPKRVVALFRRSGD